VHLVPGPDSEDRPGSWGVEDLLVTAVARRVLPEVAIRPDWTALGAPACQVAVSFGASEWVIPADDDTDPDHLARAVGARAVAR
jgi:2-iminoacetate synthase ThiH